METTSYYNQGDENEDEYSPYKSEVKSSRAVNIFNKKEKEIFFQIIKSAEGGKIDRALALKENKFNKVKFKAWDRVQELLHKEIGRTIDLRKLKSYLTNWNKYTRAKERRNGELQESKEEDHDESNFSTDPDQWNFNNTYTLQQWQYKGGVQQVKVKKEKKELTKTVEKKVIEEPATRPPTDIAETDAVLNRLAADIFAIKHLIQETSLKLKRLEDEGLRLKLRIFLDQSAGLLHNAVVTIQENVEFDLDLLDAHLEDQEFLIKEELHEDLLTEPTESQDYKLEEMPGIKVDDPPDDDELAELKFEEEQVDDPSVVESSSNRDKNKESHKDRKHYDVVCEICDESFASVTLLEKHSKKNHADERFTYACDQCDAVFGLEFNRLRYHLIEKHEKPVFKCDQCPTEFSLFNELKKHKELEHNSSQFYCSHCNSGPMLCKAFYDHHMAEMAARDKYSCKLCPFTAKAMLPYKEHRYLKHGIKLFTYRRPTQCNLCEFEGPSLEALKEHEQAENHGALAIDAPKKQRYVRKTPKLTYSCDSCEFSGILPQLVRHRTAEHGAAVNQCPRCDHVAEKYDQLYKHFNLEHLDRKFYCDQCPYVNNKKYLLELHVASKHEGTRIPCDECDAIFTLIYSLKVHKRSVHRKIKVPCTHPGCDKTFTNAPTMRKHVQVIHQGIKLYCSECGYSVGSKQKFQQHMKKHEDASSLQCDECDYVGSDAYMLNDHKNSKHKGVRFPCEVCGQLFSRKNIRRVHEQRVHNVKVRRARDKIVGIDYL